MKRVKYSDDVRLDQIDETVANLDRTRFLFLNTM